MPSIRLPSAAVVLAVLALASAGPSPADEGAPPGSSMEIWNALYARVSDEVTAGRLEASVETAAEEVRFELEKELIQSDAEIKIRRLEAARFSGAEQQQALERLIAAAAEREQRVMAAVRRLERLAGMSVVEVPPPAAAVEAVAEEAAAEEAEDPPAKKKRRFNITFQSEDLVDNPDS